MPSPAKPRVRTKAATAKPARASKATAKAAKMPVKRSIKPKQASAERAGASKAVVTRGPTFEKVRALCLALPDTKLTMTWGSPHFRVGEKIFCGFGAEDGKEVLGVKLGMSHARGIVKDARFWPAAYVGKHGWVSMNVTQRKSWDEVAALIRESYELIAPKTSLKKLR